MILQEGTKKSKRTKKGRHLTTAARKMRAQGERLETEHKSRSCNYCEGLIGGLEAQTKYSRMLLSALSVERMRLDKRINVVEKLLETRPRH